MATEKNDPFDHLLGLEDGFFEEGFDQGVKDGKRAGRIDGRLFGLEKGFERYTAMGRLHGRAMILTRKFFDDDTDHISRQSSASVKTNRDLAAKQSNNPRLKTHVRALYALTEPASLAIENTEQSMADFDDRLKRGEGKIKIIEKLTGECLRDDQFASTDASKGSQVKGDGGIEDINVLGVRH